MKLISKPKVSEGHKQEAEVKKCGRSTEITGSEVISGIISGDCVCTLVIKVSVMPECDARGPVSGLPVCSALQPVHFVQTKSQHKRLILQIS